MRAYLMGMGVLICGAALLSGVAIAQDSGDEVSAEPAAVAAWEASPVHAPPSTPAFREPEATVLFSDFESDNGGLTVNLDWEWGTSYAWFGITCYNTSYHNPPRAVPGQRNAGHGHQRLLQRPRQQPGVGFWHLQQHQPG